MVDDPARPGNRPGRRRGWAICYGEAVSPGESAAVPDRALARLRIYLLGRFEVAPWREEKAAAGTTMVRISETTASAIALS